MKCWICGQEGDSGEHMIKASDLRSHFGNISQKKPIFFHENEKRNIPLGSLNSKRFKFASLVCSKCNNSLTQPYDRAWEALSNYLRSNWPELLQSRKINLVKVFPGKVHKSMLYVHLYFVKIFGCKVVESRAPIATTSLSEALLSKKAHMDIFIGFAQRPGEVDHKYAALTPINSIDINGISAFATSLYVIDNLAVNLIYAPKIRPTSVMKDTWHPNRPAKVVRIKDL